MPLKCDAVFEGGGVKAIGLAGAVVAVESAGYEFENMAGTSAGAIIAALLAVGYSAREIEEIFILLNYMNFKDYSLLAKFGLPGKILGLVWQYGIYKGDYFENWLQELLQAKGKVKFGDIKLTDSSQEKYRYKFQAIASDITTKQMLVLPRDLKEFGFDPDAFNIARAVRMSMSIPLFYEPVRLYDSQGKEHIIVDGSVLSNYPLWLLDEDASDSPWPTFGFKLVELADRVLSWEETHHPIHSLIAFVGGLAGTMLDAHDNYHISQSHGDYQRTIAIPTTVIVGDVKKKIHAIDFAITPEESQALFTNGRTAAEKFLEGWHFEEWKKLYRETASSLS